LNYAKYTDFCQKFEKGLVGIDANLYLVEAMASILYRPIIVISTLERHSEKIYKYNTESDKPPLVYGLIKRQGHEIFLPFYLNKNISFQLDTLKDKIEVIAYVAKTVPPELRNRPILDLKFLHF
jgi:hypothetical protein